MSNVGDVAKQILWTAQILFGTNIYDFCGGSKPWNYVPTNMWAANSMKQMGIHYIKMSVCTMYYYICQTKLIN